MITDETLAWRLRQYRVQAHMKQEDIAKILGMDATAITKIESNQRKVSAREVALFATAYNVPIEVLLGKDGQPAEPVNLELKRFYLERTLDPVGISGTGVIAEGVVFSTGKVVLQWLTEYQSIGIYDSISDVLSIHGHNGTTSVVVIDVDQEDSEEG